MTSKDVLEHWMDPLSPELVNRIAKLVMDLHRGELNDGAGIEFEVVIQKAEKELDVGSYILNRLSLTCAWELKDYVSFRHAIQFLDKILRRAGQDNFGSVLNLIYYEELDNVEKLNSKLLDIANKNRDSIQQLLALILICKTHDLKKSYGKCRSVYEKIEPLLQRVYKLSPLKSLNPERQYYFFISCLELSHLHMKYEQHEARIDILNEALSMVSGQEENFDLVLKSESILLRALNLGGKSSAIKAHCEHLVEMIGLILSKTRNRDILELRFGSDLRTAFVEVSDSLRNCSEPAFISTMDNLMKVHVNSLGYNHHEVALIAAHLAKNYYYLGKTEFSNKLLQISEMGLKQGPETLEAVMFAKIRTTRVLGDLFQESKRFDEAEKYREENLRLNRKRFGMFHHSVSRSLQSLSSVLLDKGDREGAIWYLERSLEMMLSCQPHFTNHHKELECEIQNLRTRKM